MWPLSVVHAVGWFDNKNDVDWMKCLYLCYRMYAEINTMHFNWHSSSKASKVYYPRYPQNTRWHRKRGLREAIFNKIFKYKFEFFLYFIEKIALKTEFN